MKYKYLAILFVVLGFALFVNINLSTSSNSTDSSSTQNTSTIVSRNTLMSYSGAGGHVIVINEVCSGVSCPFPN